MAGQWPAPYVPWPYARKCHPIFDYVGDDIRLYMTFPLPMDQTVEPALAKWLIWYNGAANAPHSASWLDEVTYYIRRNNVGGHPARVLIKYLGPDTSFRTTWAKQWEPWGYIPVIDITT